MIKPPTSTKLFSVVFVALLIIQVVFAFVISPWVKEENFFPLHRWSLFGQVDKVYELPVIYIEEINGEKIDPPVDYFKFFEDAPGLDFLAGRDHVFAWNNFMKSGETEKAAASKRAFEAIFFERFRSVEYRIRRLQIDLIDYVLERKVVEQKAEFGPYVYGAGEE